MADDGFQLSDEQYAAVLAVKNQVQDQLLEIPGVHGVSISRKQIGGEYCGGICIAVHVTEKKSENAIPQNERIPASIQGITTDVIAHPQPEPWADTKKYRPLIGGSQLEAVGNNSNGTMGAMMKDNTSNKAVFVSCRHVLKDDRTEIVQPNTSSSNFIGTTLRGVLSQHVDGAIGSTTMSYSKGIITLGPIRRTHDVTAAEATKGYAVRKYGRTTMVTNGKVTRINWTGTRSDGWKFYDQHGIEGNSGSFGAAGDSGAFVMDSQQDITGMLWGGSGPLAGASPIKDVLAELNISLLA